MMIKAMHSRWWGRSGLCAMAVAVGIGLAAPTFGQSGDTDVKVRFDLKTPTVKAGGVARGDVIVSIPAGWHAYSNPPTGELLLPLEVSLPEDASVTLVKVVYPRGHLKEFPLLGPDPMGVYEGEVRIPVELAVAASAAGEVPITLLVDVQLCDDATCLLPQREEVTFTLLVAEAALPKSGGTVEPPILRGDGDGAVEPGPAGAEPDEGDATGEPAPGPGAEAGTESPEPVAATPVSRADEKPVGENEEDDLKNRALPLLLITAFLAGIAVNATPCVYPLIPITLSFFSTQAKGNLRAKFSLGIAYALGIALSFGVFGAVMVLVGQGLGSIFQNPWFNVFLVALLTGLALSMFGLYEIRLPMFLQRQLKGRSGSAGAFIMGSFLGVGAAPCATAVIAALAILVANSQNFPFGIMIFVTIGLGLGLPYIFLAVLGAQLPKSADWLTSVKRILGMAVILLALGLYGKNALSGFNAPLEIIYGILAASFALGALYLLYFDRTYSSRVIVGMRAVAVIVIVAFGTSFYQARADLLRDKQFQELLGEVNGEVAREIQWETFTIETFEQALTEEIPVMVDGTADWCAACQETDHRTFSKPEAVVNMRDVRAFRLDLSTGVDEEYVKETQEFFGILSLPHIRFYNKNGDLIHIHKEFMALEKLLDVLAESGVDIIRRK